MELAKIEAILEAYFEGNTSLEQEALLHEYFDEGNVAPHLQVYQSLFTGLKVAREETHQKEIILPKKTKEARGWWLSIAASVVLAIGVAGFVFSGDGMTQEEQEALVAFNKTKESLLLLSQNLNKGTEGLATLNQFTEAKNKVLK